MELNTSIPGFSYEQFASVHGHDLRFLTSDGKTELAYEPIEWKPSGNSSFWVLLDQLDENTSIQAIWAIPTMGSNPHIVGMDRSGRNIVLSGIWTERIRL